MGGSSSKEEAPASPPVVDSGSKVSESSSGFHIIEIHSPSAGFGVLAVLFVLVAVFSYRAWRKMKKRNRSREEQLPRWGHMAYPGLPPLYRPPFPRIPGEDRFEEVDERDPGHRSFRRGLPNSDDDESRPTPAMAHR